MMDPMPLLTPVLPGQDVIDQLAMLAMAVIGASQAVLVWAVYKRRDTDD